VRRRLPYTLWRRSHCAAYAAWSLVLAHGLGAGTDRGTKWLRIVDALCVGLVGAALAWRLTSVEEPARRPARDRVAA
jgi:sulfoxide reductase heme-binding subunit YedZ